MYSYLTDDEINLMTYTYRGIHCIFHICEVYGYYRHIIFK